MLMAKLELLKLNSRVIDFLNNEDETKLIEMLKFPEVLEYIKTIEEISIRYGQSDMRG